MERTAIVTLAFLLSQFVAVPAVAQIPGLPVTAPTPPPAAPPPDQFGRDTPRGTIQGFNRAVTRHDMAAAANYLQLPTDQRGDSEELSLELTDLMDRYFTQALVTINDTPTGSLTDGLPPDRERIASLRTGAEPLDVDLVRVTNREGGSIWLIARETLRAVPAVHLSMEATWIERVMPRRLVDATLFGVSPARWIVLIASVAIPYLVLWLLSMLVIAAIRRAIRDPIGRTLFESWRARLRGPMLAIATLLVNVIFIRVLGFPLRFRFLYAQTALIAAAVLGCWLVWRLSALAFERARLVASRRHEAGVTSLLLLAERIVKVVIVLATIFLFLTIAGVDTTTALAGLGLGGVAVALGAQKTVENLLGGVFLLTDKALAVGDTCRIQNRVGVIEDITLRSVRLRTLDQTLVSVPAGILSQESVENFATRGSILIQSTLRLRYGTSAGQLTTVLQRIRALLAEHPQIATETSRIRLVDFGVRAIELELFAYVTTADFNRFLQVREDLFLAIATVVEASGTAFASQVDATPAG